MHTVRTLLRKRIHDFTMLKFTMYLLFAYMKHVVHFRFHVTDFWLHHICTFGGVGGGGGVDRVSRSHFADSVNAYWRSRPGTFSGAGGSRPIISIFYFD